MNTANVAAICGLTLLSTATGFSQLKAEQPNFSGTWTFDQMSPVVVANGQTVTVTRSNPDACVPLKLVVHHSDVEFRTTTISKCKNADGIDVTTEKVRAYFTDGRGETNEFFENPLSESTTKQEGRTIVISILKTIGKNKSVEKTRKYGISKKLDKLTIRDYRGEGRGFYLEYVFRRQ